MSSGTASRPWIWYGPTSEVVICGWEGGKNFAAGAGSVGGRVGVAVVREPVL
jgi:hypothetical protein